MMINGSIIRSAVVILVSLLGGGIASGATQPALPAQVPGFYRLRVGDVEITALSDRNPASPANPGKAPATAPINGYLVDTRGMLVLIDVGAGTLLGPGEGALVGNLRAAGFEPEQVAEIYVTQVLPDHVGGLVRERKPMFPTAIVRALRVEANFWLAKSSLAAAAVEERQRFAEIGAAFRPYVNQRRLETFDGETIVGPGISALPVSGPSRGPTLYLASSQGEKILFLGDEDLRAPASTHVGLLEEAATRGYWVAEARQPFPGFGHLRATRHGFEWIPSEKTAR